MKRITVDELFSRCVQPAETIVIFYIDDSFLKTDIIRQVKLWQVLAGRLPKKVLDSYVDGWDFAHNTFRVVVDLNEADFMADD